MLEENSLQNAQQRPGDGDPKLDDSLAETRPVRIRRRAVLRRIHPQPFAYPLPGPQHDSEKTQPVHLRQKAAAIPTSLTHAAKPKPGTSDTRPIQIVRRVGIWVDAQRRLLHNPEGLFGLVVIVLMILVAIFAEWISPYPVREIHLGQTNLPPFWVERSKTGAQGTLEFPLGTDRLGRDLLSWAVMGTRTSMLLGLVSAPLIGLTGLVLGLLAGYAGGWVDNLLMRVTDIFYAFPTLMISILVILVLRDTPFGEFQNGLLLLFTAFLTFGWAGAARLVRAAVLSVKNAEYIEAAHALGIPGWRIIFRHIMPNCLAPLLVWVTLMVPQLILTEAVLGYLQINMGPVGYREAFFDTSWGGMIREGRSYIHIQPFTILIPASFVGLISIAFTFLGDALRDALDPVNLTPRGKGG